MQPAYQSGYWKKPHFTAHPTPQDNFTSFKGLEEAFSCCFPTNWNWTVSPTFWSDERKKTFAPTGGNALTKSLFMCVLFGNRPCPGQTRGCKGEEGAGRLCRKKNMVNPNSCRAGRRKLDKIPVILHTWKFTGGSSLSVPVPWSVMTTTAVWNTSAGISVSAIWGDGARSEEFCLK